MKEWDGKDAPGRFSYGLLAIGYVLAILGLIGVIAWVIVDVFW